MTSRRRARRKMLNMYVNGLVFPIARFSNRTFMDFLLFPCSVLVFSFPGPRFGRRVCFRPKSTNMCSLYVDCESDVYNLQTQGPRNVCLAAIIQTFVNETAAGEIPRDQPLIKMPLSVCAMLLLFKHTKKTPFSQSVLLSSVMPITIRR